MPAINDTFHVEIYYADYQERTRAHQECERTRPGSTQDYDGVVEGLLTQDQIRALTAEGFVIAPTTEQPVVQSVLGEGGAESFSFGLASDGGGLESLSFGLASDEGGGESAATPAPDPASLLAGVRPRVADFPEQLQLLREQAWADAVGSGGSARGSGADSESFGLSQSDVELEGGLESMVGNPMSGSPRPVACEVRMSGPMRPEWHEELAIRRLEICSFEPLDRYRIFLTPEQQGEVRSLPFVQEIRRYGIAETVTPELLEALRAAAEPGMAAVDGGLEAFSAPEPAADAAPAAAPPEAFDTVLHRAQDLPAVRQVIDADPDAEVLDVSDRMLRFRAPLKSPLLGVLADMDEVKLLSPYRAPSLYLDYGRQVVGLETINRDAAPPDRWTGKGQVVAIFDSGIDPEHPDLKDRIERQLAVEGTREIDRIGHGTHVAGIIAGTGAASGGKICGIAPGAKLVSVSITNEKGKLLIGVDLAVLLEKATQHGAKIINLSWGQPISGSYDQGSAAVDQFVYKYPDVLVVVAAGNSGTAPAGYCGFRSVGTPATAKNVLTVGACGTGRPQLTTTWGVRWRSIGPAPPASEAPMNSPNTPAPLSSRGPTDEPYRVKPDVLAPGIYVLSTRASGISRSYYEQGWPEPQPPDESFEPFRDWYAFLGGTSMAAPVAAGAAAVLRQYLVEGLQIQNPSAALLKAILIASARPLEPQPHHASPAQDLAVGFPDFDQGFGRIDLANILPHPGAPPNRKTGCIDVANDSPEALQSRAREHSKHRSVRLYRFEVARGATEPVRIVIAWTDHPGNGLQNVLQIEVRGPGGLKMTGNQRHSFGRIMLPGAETSYDRRNNVQQVTIGQWSGQAEPVVEDPDDPSVPPAGPYVIRVLAQNTAFPPQGYALCVCGELAADLQKQ